MPMPEERRHLSIRDRVQQMKNAAKLWNDSYCFNLSWSDLASGAGRRLGSVAYSLGKAVTLDSLKGATLDMISVDSCSAVGSFGSMARHALGDFAAYASSDGADRVTTQAVDGIWGGITDFCMENVEAAASYVNAGATGREASRQFGSQVDGFDPVAAMPEIKELFIDTLVTLAELHSISNAPQQQGLLNFRYCDDAHAMWTKYYRIQSNVETLHQHCANMKQFATKAEQTVREAMTGIDALEASLTTLTEAVVDSDAIPHYQGGGMMDVQARMGQCSHVKCYGPA